jgi:Tfp pilus assembly protein PilF
VLGQLISEEQRTEYQRAYEVDTNEANKILLSFSSRKLARDQTDSVTRIRSFLQQAAEARANDWALAANLARRAAILAREIAGRLQ